MLFFIQKLKNTEFIKNTFTLGLGNILAQILQFFSIFILTKLYTPKDFGFFAFFIALGSLLVIFATGRFEYALMLPRANIVAVIIFFTSVSLSVLISLVTMLFIIVLRNFFQIENFLYLLPVWLFFKANSNLFNLYLNRLKKYKILSILEITRVLVTVTGQIFFGVLKLKALGLLLGQLTALIIIDAISGFIIFSDIKNRKIKRRLNIRRILRIIQQYSGFFLYSTWSTLIGVLGHNLLMIMIKILWSEEVLGKFFIAYRILEVPITSLGYSVARIFFKEISAQRFNRNTVLTIFFNVLKYTLSLSFLIYFSVFIASFLIYYWLPIDWKDITIYILILLPFSSIKFIGSVLSIIIITYQAFFLEFIMKLLISLVPILIGFIVSILFNSFEIFLIVYSFSMALVYLTYILFAYKIIKNKSYEK